MSSPVPSERFHSHLLYVNRCVGTHWQGGKCTFQILVTKRCLRETLLPVGSGKFVNCDTWNKCKPVSYCEPELHAQIWPLTSRQQHGVPDSASVIEFVVTIVLHWSATIIIQIPPPPPLKKKFSCKCSCSHLVWQTLRQCDLNRCATGMQMYITGPVNCLQCIIRVWNNILHAEISSGKSKGEETMPLFREESSTYMTCQCFPQ